MATITFRMVPKGLLSLRVQAASEPHRLVGDAAFIDVQGSGLTWLGTNDSTPIEVVTLAIAEFPRDLVAGARYHVPGHGACVLVSLEGSGRQLSAVFKDAAAHLVARRLQIPFFLERLTDSDP